MTDAEISEVKTWLVSHGCMLSESPIFDREYQYLGCYILNWGSSKNPTLGLNRIETSSEFFAFLNSLRS